MPKEKRRRKAPYISIKALMDFLDHIRYVSTPKKVDAGLLEDYGVSKGNIFALLSALKFLGLVDDQGSPTPAFSTLQTMGEEFQGNLHEVIQNAYGDLFARLDVNRDSREHIRNYFARNFSVSQSERATSLFLDLCREAGIPVATESRGGKAESVERARVTKPATKQMRQPVQPPLLLSEGQPSVGSVDSKTIQGTLPSLSGMSIRIDSKDLVSMNSQQIQALFEGLSKVIKKEKPEVSNDANAVS
jgi:hypothetical protein